MGALGTLLSNASPAAGDVTATLDGWTNLTLASGVSAVSTGTYGTPGFYIDPFGFVRFRGMVSKNTAGSTALAVAGGNLPQPSGGTGAKRHIFPAHRNAAPPVPHRLDLLDNGAAGFDLHFYNGTAAENNVGVSLAQVHYRTDLPTMVNLGTLSTTHTLDAEFDFAHEDWINVNFVGGGAWHDWGDPYTTCQYCMTLDGTVHLKGLAYGGNVNVTMFTLPAGYRPSKAAFFQVLENDGRGRIQVATNGDVQANGPFDGGNGATYVSLDWVSFRI